MIHINATEAPKSIRQMTLHLTVPVTIKRDSNNNGFYCHVDILGSKGIVGRGFTRTLAVSDAEYKLGCHVQEKLFW